MLLKMSWTSVAMPQQPDKHRMQAKHFRQESMLTLMIDMALKLALMIAMIRPNLQANSNLV